MEVPTGQYVGLVHTLAGAIVNPAGQAPPAGQGVFFEGVGQTQPAGHGAEADVPAGQ